MIERFGSFALKFLFVVATLLILAWAAISYGSQLESRINPVQEEWTPVSVEVDGLDVVITGMVLKTRGCEYMPPPRARDVDGKHYTVVSTSPTSSFSWRPLNTPQWFGPWRVIGGRGVELEMYQQHHCHDFWPTFSILGRISTPPLKGKP